MIHCWKCGKQNTRQATNCVGCGVSLDENTQKIWELKKELAAAKQQFLGVAALLENKINLLQQKIESQSIADTQAKQTDEQETDIYLWAKQQTTHQETTQDEPIMRSVVEETIEEIVVSADATPQVAAFHSGIWGQMQEIYTHYKDEGKLPAFLMMAIGITALLLGFGYLLQFAAGWLAEMLRFSASVGASSLVMTAGIRLLRQDSKYREFGSALVGLSISLNYLIIYFSTYTEHLAWLAFVPVSFALILTNTALAGILALRYETKIVAVISLLGGVFAPFYVQDMPLTFFYFLYLWIVSAGSLYVASKIRWQSLSWLTFIAVNGVVHYTLYQPTVFLPAWGFVVLLHAFTALFVWVSVIENGTLRTTFSPESILMVFGSIGLQIFGVFTVLEGNLQGERIHIGLGLVCLANAALYGGLLRAFYRLFSPKIQTTVGLLIGIWLALAFPALLGARWVGLFWSLEAVALIYSGFLFELRAVRTQGYTLLGITFFRMAWSMFFISGEWEPAIFTEEWQHLLVISVVCYGVQPLFKRFTDLITRRERDIQIFLLEMGSVSVSAWFWLTSYALFEEFSFVLAFIGVFVWLKVATRFHLPFTELVGYAHLFLLVVGYWASTNETQTTVYAFQTLYGKICGAEFFILLWLIQLYYDKVLIPSESDEETPKHRLYGIATTLRHLFFVLLPAIFLPTVNRLYPQWLSTVVWFSFGMSVMLAYYRRTSVQLLASYLYFFLAIFLIFDTEPTPNAHIATLLAWALVATVLRIWQDTPTKADSLFTLYSLYLSVSLFGLTNVAYGAGTHLTSYSIFACWFSLMMITSPFVRPFRYYANALQILYFAVMTYSVLLGVAFILWSDSYWVQYGGASRSGAEGFPLVVAALAASWHLYRQESPKPFLLVLYHLQWVGVYGIALSWFSVNWAGVPLTILLSIHIITLLFLSVKPHQAYYAKLALTYLTGVLLKMYWLDLANFSDVEKVITFMVIGVLMLLGAYLFVRIKKQQEPLP